jgi:hypothetical protein
MDDNMKDMVKITVIAAGFKETARTQHPQQKQSFLPRTWKAGREVPEQAELPVTPPNVVNQVKQNVREVREVTPEVAKDDLDVPTFLRRQAQKA